MWSFTACKLCGDWSTNADSADPLTTSLPFVFVLALYTMVIVLDVYLWILMSVLQYLRLLLRKIQMILERYALLVCLALIWAFAAILTVSGAYNNVSVATKLSCRTDRSFLMSAAPWFVSYILVFFFIQGQISLESVAQFSFLTGLASRTRSSGGLRYSERVMCLECSVLRLSHLQRYNTFISGLLASTETTSSYCWYVCVSQFFSLLEYFLLHLDLLEQQHLPHMSSLAVSDCRF